MASKKLFKGLASGIAHHSHSHFSYLHPHLGRAAKAAGMSSIILDLLDGPNLPSNVESSKELELAIPAWRKRFREMATKIGADIQQLSSAKIDFDFSTWEDLYSADVTAIFTLKDGTVYEVPGWRPKIRRPEDRVPGTNLDWPDQFLQTNRSKKLMKKEAMEQLDQIRSILMEDWDPIGVSEFVEARDEYDTYVNEIYSMFLRGDLTKENLYEYLMRSATDDMGLTQVSNEATKIVVQKITDTLDFDDL